MLRQVIIYSFVFIDQVCSFYMPVLPTNLVSATLRIRCISLTILTQLPKDTRTTRSHLNKGTEVEETKKRRPFLPPLNFILFKPLQPVLLPFGGLKVSKSMLLFPFPMAVEILTPFYFYFPSFFFLLFSPQ